MRVERRPEVRAVAVLVLERAERHERRHPGQVPKPLGEIDLVVGQRLRQRFAAGGLERAAEITPGFGSGLELRIPAHSAGVYRIHLELPQGKPTG